MKKLKVFVLSFLLVMLTVEADPVLTHSWDPPTTYENNQPIVNDQLSYVFWCGSDQGGPYDIPIIATPRESTAAVPRRRA